MVWIRLGLNILIRFKGLIIWIKLVSIIWIGLGLIIWIRSGSIIWVRLLTKRTRGSQWCHNFRTTWWRCRPAILGSRCKWCVPTPAASPKYQTPPICCSLVFAVLNASDHVLRRVFPEHRWWDSFQRSSNAFSLFSLQQTQVNLPRLDAREACSSPTRHKWGGSHSAGALGIYIFSVASPYRQVNLFLLRLTDYLIPLTFCEGSSKTRACRFCRTSKIIV